MTRSAALAALAAALMLTACVEPSAGPVLIAPTAADRASPAYAACRAELARTTNRPQSDITITSFVFSEANTEILAEVAGAEAPWRCLSSTDGVVAEVMYTGSEGAL